MMKWDARNLRLIMRNVHLFEIGRSGKNEEDIIKLIVKSPMDASIRNLVNARTMDEMATALEGSAFDLSAYISQYRQSGSLSLLENSLYKIVYEAMLKELPPNEPEVKRYFSMMIDVQNLKMLLRAKRDNMSYQQIEPFLIKGGELMDRIMKGFDEFGITDIINGLEGTAFYKPLTEVLPEYKEESLFVFENVLDGLISRTGMDISTSYPFGMGPIIGFLAVKDMESKSLRRIMTAKYLNLPPDEIKSSMISI
jgi:V/A-type H+-transporting ATPase subunit C